MNNCIAEVTEEEMYQQAALMANDLISDFDKLNIGTGYFKTVDDLMDYYTINHAKQNALKNWRKSYTGSSNDIMSFISIVND